MKKINVLLIFKSISILTLMLNLGLTNLYSQDIIGHKKNNPHKNFNTQLFASVNYVNKSGEEDTYLRKGYLINLGFSKPFYNEGTYNFNKTFSLVSSVTFGENASDGALKDIQKQKVPVSFAVINSLKPSFTTVPAKARNISIGIGIREDILFKNIGIGISGIVGYQRINRPEFYLADNSLTKYNNTEKIVYAWSQAQTASGLFFKPSFDITYWLNSRLAIYTVIEYSFGPKFKGQQTNWNATNIDGDAYFSVEEIRRGYLSTKAFDKPINTFSAGVGLKYVIKHKD